MAYGQALMEPVENGYKHHHAGMRTAIEISKSGAHRAADVKFGQRGHLFSRLAQRCNLQVSPVFCVCVATWQPPCVVIVLRIAQQHQRFTVATAHNLIIDNSGPHVPRQVLAPASVPLSWHVVTMARSPLQQGSHQSSSPAPIFSGLQWAPAMLDALALCVQARWRSRGL